MKEIKDQAILFVGDEHVKQKMIRVLERLSYQIEIIPFITDNTIEQITSGSHQVIILEDGFQNLPLRENPIYRGIVNMNMGLRRNIYLAIMGKGIKHLEPMDAFSLSADLLLDTEKIEEEELVNTLKQEISTYFQFYQVYNMVKKQLNQGGG